MLDTIQVQSKVYYEVATGNILVTTCECEGHVIQRSKEEDIKVYPELQGKESDAVDYIEIEYGTSSKIKSYSVNLKTKALDIVYFTEEEILAMQQPIQPTVSDEQILQDRIANVSEYLESNNLSISDIEDYILQKELKASSVV